MKRIALLTVLLLVVGLSLGFAQEFKPALSWSVGGTASLSWGIDLDDGSTGFVNAGSATLKLTLVPDVTLSKGADAPVYGWIELTQTGWTLTGTTWAGGGTAVKAKIVAKPFEIGINGTPTLTTGTTGSLETATDGLIIDAGDVEAALAAPAYGTTGGTYVGYVADTMAFYAKIDSVGYYDGSNVANNYAAGLDGWVKFAPVKVSFGAYDGLWTGAVAAGYVGVALDAIGPISSVGVKADFNLSTPAAFDLSGNFDLLFGKDTTLKTKVAYGDNFNGFDVQVDFALGSLVANLTETLTAKIFDIGTTTVGKGLEYAIVETLSYKIDAGNGASVTPEVKVSYAQNFEDADALLTVAPAVTAAGFIPNTTFKLVWTPGDFIVTAPVVQTMGDIVFTATVAY